MRARLRSFSQKQFVRDAVMLQIATLVQGATYFLTSVLTKHYLGLEDLGRWVTSRELFMFAYFFVSMGVINATVSRYAACVGRQDREGAVQTLAAMVKVGGGCSLIVLLLGFTLGPWAGERFYNSREVGVFAAFLCVSGLFEVVRGVTVAVLQGTRQMREYSRLDVITNGLRVGIVWLALALGFGIPGVVGAFLVHMLAASWISRGFYRRAQAGPPKLAPPPLREVLAAVPGAPVGHIFGTGYLLALNKAMNTLVPRIGMLLIPAGAAATMAAQAEANRANGAYSIGHVLAWGLGLALTGVAGTLLPALGLKMGTQDIPFEKLGGYLRRISLVTGTLMAAATLLSVGPVWLVVQYAYGADATEAFTYFCWLASGNLVIGFTVVVEAFYIYSGKLRAALPWNFLMAAVAFAGIVLAKQHFGPIGVAAAAGTCRALALFHLVYIWVYFRRVRSRARAGVAPELPPDGRPQA